MGRKNMTWVRRRRENEVLGNTTLTRPTHAAHCTYSVHTKRERRETGERRERRRSKKECVVHEMIERRGETGAEEAADAAAKHLAVWA